MNDLINLSACEMVDLLNQEKISIFDALDALEQRIDEVEGQVNALPILCFDRARAYAQRLQSRPVADRGILRGLPVPIKDLTEVAHVRTTYGSKCYENFIPDFSDVLVERLENNGAVVYAKSNSPEFGAGGNTFNDVFGKTRNPYNLSKSAGGSSGGAAAALASGTAWLAHGSDLAGSLRTPTSFCGVTSLRPTPGLISNPLDQDFGHGLAQEGPMARSIEDLALFTDAMANTSSTCASFLASARAPQCPQKIAFSTDLGVTKTASEVIEVCQTAMRAIAKNGSKVDIDHPDLSAAHEAFDVQRAFGYAKEHSEILRTNRDLLKPEVVWNIEQGQAINENVKQSALAAQARVEKSAVDFMQNYDLLICPAAIVPPNNVDERYLGFFSGVPYADYYRWLSIAYVITATKLPVITMPAGMTKDGLPIGIQLIGKPNREHQLFAFAKHIELIMNWDNRPIDPRM